MAGLIMTLHLGHSPEMCLIPVLYFNFTGRAASVRDGAKPCNFPHYDAGDDIPTFLLGDVSNVRCICYGGVGGLNRQPDIVIFIVPPERLTRMVVAHVMFNIWTGGGSILGGSICFVTEQRLRRRSEREKESGLGCFPRRNAAEKARMGL